MKKRNVFIVLCMVLCLTSPLFAQAQQEADNKTLTVWYVSTFVDSMKEDNAKMIREFEEKYDCTVNFQYISDTDAPKKYALVIEGGNPPDVAEFGTPGMIKYAAADQLLDVTDLFNGISNRSGGHFGIAEQGVSYMGSVYGVPVGFQAQLEYWRTDLLDQAGIDVPETWEELYEAGLKLNDPADGFYAIGQPLSSCNDTRQWLRGLLWGYGAGIVKEDSVTINIDSPETKAALTYLKKAYDAGMFPEGAVSWDGGGNNNAYLSDRTLYIENSMSVYAAMKKDKPALIDATLLNTGVAGPAGKASFGGVFSYAIFRDAKNPDLAKEFIKFFYEEDRYEAFIAGGDGYYAPVFENFMDIPLFSDPFFNPLMEQVKYSFASGYPGDPSPEAQEVFDRHILVDMMQRVLLEDWDIQKAIDYAEDEIIDIYNQ